MAGEATRETLRLGAAHAADAAVTRATLGVPSLSTLLNAMKKLLAVLAAALVAGCAGTPYTPVPEGYTGPRVTIADSYRVLSSSKTEFFYVEAVDGNPVPNSRITSLNSNRGNGMLLKPVPVQRELPADRPTTLALVARTEYGAPIMALMREVYQVKGTLDFTPEPGKRYVVRGQLGAAASAVWVEDADTNAVVGHKIEAQGLCQAWRAREVAAGPAAGAAGLV